MNTQNNTIKGRPGRKKSTLDKLVPIQVYATREGRDAAIAYCNAKGTTFSQEVYRLFKRNNRIDIKKRDKKTTENKHNHLV